MTVVLLIITGWLACAALAYVISQWVYIQYLDKTCAALRRGRVVTRVLLFAPLALLASLIAFAMCLWEMREDD